MQQIVECVPNFSEGHRLDVIDAIVASIDAVPNVAVLHRTSDVYHNRSVITFAGTPQATVEAAFLAIETAAQHINMDKHRGVHPRLGATDVVPFVPIKGITLEDCADLARQLGKRVAEELNIPVYLYEAAATRPERKNLADLRRGEYEGLKNNILLQNRKPDFGEARIGTAGATIIGARHKLIAYNVYLNTNDVQIAKNIAKKIRFSSGGLIGVKALGLLVGGRAQVSMNLTDYKRTPLHRVIEMIRQEAKRYAVQIQETELIGLMPRDALLDTAAWYLQLPSLQSTQIIEDSIQQILLDTNN